MLLLVPKHHHMENADIQISAEKQMQGYVVACNTVYSNTIRTSVESHCYAVCLVAWQHTKILEPNKYYERCTDCVLPFFVFLPQFIFKPSAILVLEVSRLEQLTIYLSINFILKKLSTMYVYVSLQVLFFSHQVIAFVKRDLTS